MDSGERLTYVADVIYQAAVNILQAENIPPVLGRVVVGDVYRRFTDHVYKMALEEIASLEEENMKLKEENKGRQKSESESE